MVEGFPGLVLVDPGVHTLAIWRVEAIEGLLGAELRILVPKIASVKKDGIYPVPYFFSGPR
jgi:hypothetical protein